MYYERDYIMKNVLIVSSCQKREKTIGLIGGLLNVLKGLDKSKYHISLFDTNYYEASHDPNDYPVDEYFCVPDTLTKKFIKYIPKIRGLYPEWIIVKTYENIVRLNNFDIVVVYQVPFYVDRLVKIAHDYDVKIVLDPFGSDILRISGKAKERIMMAFAEIDGVIGRQKSNVLIAAQELYKVPAEKIMEQRECLRSVQMLKEVKGLLSREDMHRELGLPYSNYNIVCGYNGSEAQRHREIIDSLLEVKKVLPNDYQVIFPMTYGAGDFSNYITELRSICKDAGLRSFFFTDFMTREQMAYLHLITDLFIEIQPTDNGNAFLIEALYAQNQIVTGRWLNYYRFEQFGIPYYLIDSPNDLSIMLYKIFTHQVEKAHVPQDLIDFFDVPEGYDRRTFWIELFNNL